MKICSEHFHFCFFASFSCVLIQTRMNSQLIRTKFKSVHLAQQRFSSQFTKKSQTFRHPATAHFLCQRYWGTLSLCFFDEKDQKKALTVEAILGCQWRDKVFGSFSLNKARRTLLLLGSVAAMKLVESKIMYIISIKYLFFAPTRNRLVCWPKMPKPPKIVFVAYELRVNFTTTSKSKHIKRSQKTLKYYINLLNRKRLHSYRFIYTCKEDG